MDSYQLDPGDFEFIEQITESLFGLTRIIQHKKTKNIYVETNFINSDDDYEENDQKQKYNDLIRILAQNQHKTIISLKGYFIQSFSGKDNFSIITGYADNKSLRDILTKYLQNDDNIIRNFTQTKVQILLVGISRGMMLLNKHNIIHGNLNTFNVLIDEKFYPQISDFYKSKFFNNFNIAQDFIAPELTEKKEFNEKTDVYSFGMIMYYLLSIVNPKSNKVFKSGSVIQMPDYISKSFQDLIKKCLSVNQEERPKFEEIFKMVTYDKSFYLESIDLNELSEYINSITNDPIFCTICQEKILNNDLLYYSGFPYHKYCIKCSVCKKKINLYDEFTCIGQNLFLCHNHCKDPSSSHELAHCQDEITKNIIKEKFDFQFFNKDNIDNCSQDEIFIDSKTIENSFQINKPYELFIPTVTFHFDISPEKFDYKKLEEILGDNAVIIKVENGSTLLKIALIAANKIPKTIEEFREYIEPIKDQIESTFCAPIASNLIDEPTITFPDEESIKESFNLFQNAKFLEQVNSVKIKDEIYQNLSQEKNKNKDWKYIFENKKLYDEAEKAVRAQIKENPIEIVVTGQTIIVNKYLYEYEKIKQEIPEEKMCESFVYHGSTRNNHQSIIKNHFYMPGDKNIKRRDEGFFGSGIYATDNMFYAAGYAYDEFQLLTFNNEAPVILCLSVYNEDYDIDASDLDSINDESIKSNYGIHHALVGSITNYHRMDEHFINKSFVYGTEYVFPNRYQIVPICSFIVKRTDHFILWKDENIDNNENKYYMEELSHKAEVNIYFKRNVEDALKLIELKKRNKFKLITNAGKNLSGKTLIEKARKIVGSNFVCLVFGMNPSHLEWVCKMENVLFTNNDDDFRKFATIKMNKEEIIKFSNELGNKYNVKFKINEKSLLTFSVTSSFK